MITRVIAKFVGFLWEVLWFALALEAAGRLRKRWFGKNDAVEAVVNRWDVITA